MQIAKMFASLGFKVDTSGLVVFKKAIADARRELTNLNQSGKNSTRQLRNLRREVDKLSSAMGKIKGTAGAGKVSQAYSNIAASAHKLNNAFNAIVLNRKKVTHAIGKINSSVFAGLNHWDRYRRSVVQTRRALLNLNREISNLRANSRVDVRINNRNTGGGGGGGSGAAGGIAAGLGMRGLLSSVLPAAALAGLGGGVGYAGAAMVGAGRDQTRMENTLLLTSTSAADLADTLNYVKSEALRLGITSVELGKSFSQMNLSAKSLSKTEKKEMFTGFSEFMVAMGTDKEGQKGILKAFNQMFALGKISQEEINQLSEHGVPATLIYDSAMKAHNLDSIKAVKDLQQKGGLIPEKVLMQFSKDMQKLANDSGALAKAKESSQFKQNVFFESLKQSSKRIMDEGLDEQLGKLFESLTKLTVELENIVTSIRWMVDGIKGAKKYLDELTGGNTVLALVLFFLAGRFKFLFKAVRLSNRIMQRGGGIMKAMTALMRGIFGRALGGIILKFTLWSVAIAGVGKMLAWLGREVKRDDLGGWTIFDDLALKLEVAGLHFDILAAKTALYWQNFKNLSSPFLASNGEGFFDGIARNMGYSTAPAPTTQPVPVKEPYNVNNRPHDVWANNKKTNGTMLNDALSALRKPPSLPPLLARPNSNTKSGGKTLNAAINIIMPNGSVVRQDQTVNLF